MSGIHKLDAALQLVYVLKLPDDHAEMVRQELLHNGVSEHSIRTIDPKCRSSSSSPSVGSRTCRFTGKPLATNKLPTTGKASGAEGPGSRTPKNKGAVPAVPKSRAGSARGRRGDCGASKRRPAAAETPKPAVATADRLKSGTRSRHGVAVQFLPSTIRLGTYGGGRYDVVMRRRVRPEGPETVWISMAAEAVSSRASRDAARESAPEAADGPHPSQTVGLPGDVADGAENEVTARRRDCGDDGLVTIARCRCSSAECDAYKEVLRRYFADCDYDDHRGRVDGNDADTYDRARDRDSETKHNRYRATKCVYKKIADVLLKNEIVHDEIVDGEQDAAIVEGQGAATVDGQGAATVEEQGAATVEEQGAAAGEEQDVAAVEDEATSLSSSDALLATAVVDDRNDDGGGGGGSGGVTTTEIAPDATSRQASATERTTAADVFVRSAVPPSTPATGSLKTAASPTRLYTTDKNPARIRTTDKNPARIRTTDKNPANMRTTADAQQATAKKSTFFDRLLRRNKQLAADRSTSVRRQIAKK